MTRATAYIVAAVVSAVALAAFVVLVELWPHVPRGEGPFDDNYPTGW